MVRVCDGDVVVCVCVCDAIVWLYLFCYILSDRSWRLDSHWVEHNQKSRRTYKPAAITNCDAVSVCVSI